MRAKGSDMEDEVLEEIRGLRASVESFRAQVESLEAKVESLETDNARLRDSRASVVGSDRGGDAAVDRRQLLKLAGKSAVVGTGLATGAALLGAQPAAADHLPGFGHDNNAGSAQTRLRSTINVPGGGGVAFGVENVGNATGVDAVSNGTAIAGWSPGGTGVEGASDVGTGVFAYSLRSNAITARIFEDFSNGFNAVYATTASTGNGVFGEVTNTSGPGNAVLGIHRGPGNCVFGFKPGGVAGDAVVGYSQTANSRGVLGLSTNGRGGAFSGKQAQVQLLASAATTHPSSGARGDLFVDKSGRLWFCKGSTTWKQLA